MLNIGAELHNMLRAVARRRIVALYAIAGREYPAADIDDIVSDAMLTMVVRQTLYDSRRRYIAQLLQRMPLVDAQRIALVADVKTGAALAVARRIRQPLAQPLPLALAAPPAPVADNSGLAALVGKLCAAAPDCAPLVAMYIGAIVSGDDIDHCRAAIAARISYSTAQRQRRRLRELLTSED